MVHKRSRTKLQERKNKSFSTLEINYKDIPNVVPHIVYVANTDNRFVDSDTQKREHGHIVTECSLNEFNLVNTVNGWNNARKLQIVLKGESK
jgi:hypothetical protein